VGDTAAGPCDDCLHASKTRLTGAIPVYTAAQVQWLTALFEGKLTKSQGRRAADSGACSIQ